MQPSSVEYLLWHLVWPTCSLCDPSFRQIATDILIHARCQAWAPCVEGYLAHDWNGLADRLAAFQAAYPDDGPAKVLQERCAEYLRHPPPQDWDCTQHYDKK